MLRAARRLAEIVGAAEPQMLPIEILVIDGDTMSVVAEIDGVDFIMTMMAVPKQRPRPAKQ